MSKSATTPFRNAAESVDEKSEFKKHFRTLKKEMRRLAKTLPKNDDDPTHLNPIEEGLKKAFTNFLKSMNYQVALGNFEILLKEKSGDKHFRDDGSVNWLHEFLPIFEILTMASQGKHNDGFDIEDLDEYGGLEMSISTHLRHDSKEDFKLDIVTIRAEQENIVAKISNPEKYKKNNFIDKLISNIEFISQLRIQDGTPKGTKESVITYILRIIQHPDSNPIVLISKMADIGNNLSTMLKSAKFTPEKRLKTCNDREDMFGPRQGFTEEAIERWPKFKSAIKTLDCGMGVLLYPHFRYLANVDLHHKEPTEGRVGIGKYLKKALALDIPEEFNKIHIFFKRMKTSVHPNNSEKYTRLSNFMRDVIKPALQKCSNKFPYLFPANDNSLQRGANALPKGAAYAPIFL